MRLLYEDAELSVRGDKSGYYVFRRVGGHVGGIGADQFDIVTTAGSAPEFYQDPESLLRAIGATMDDPADWMRITAVKFED